MGAVGQLQQGMAASSAARHNAQAARMEAQAIKVSGKREEEKLAREKKKMGGAQKAAYAKAGVLFEGSPFEVMSDTATQYELDLNAQKYNTQMGVSRAHSEAEYQRSMAGAYRTAGFIGAGATLLTGVGRVGYGTGRF